MERLLCITLPCSRARRWIINLLELDSLDADKRHCSAKQPEKPHPALDWMFEVQQKFLFDARVSLCVVTPVRSVSAGGASAGGPRPHDVAESSASVAARRPVVARFLYCSTRGTQTRFPPGTSTSTSSKSCHWDHGEGALASLPKQKTCWHINCAWKKKKEMNFIIWTFCWGKVPKSASINLMRE